MGYFSPYRIRKDSVKERELRDGDYTMEKRNYKNKYNTSVTIGNISTISNEIESNYR